MPLKYHNPRRVTDISELKPGDHIRCPTGPMCSSSCACSGFYHHMLVVSVVNDRIIRVIHYTRSSEKGEIKEEDEDVSSYIDSIDILKYKELPEGVSEYSACEAIKKARSKVGETDYNLIFNNCEHFINECKTGVAQSCQVLDTAKLAIGFAVAGAILVGVGAVIFYFLRSEKNEGKRIA